MMTTYSASSTVSAHVAPSAPAGHASCSATPAAQAKDEKTTAAAEKSKNEAAAATIDEAADALARVQVDDIPLPAHWEAVDLSHGNRHLVQLITTSYSRHHAEYQRILTAFYSSSPAKAVHAVYRIQNPHLYRRYERRKQQLREQQVAFTEHTRVYHGTTAIHPSLIYDSAVGFDPAQGKSAHPQSGTTQWAWFAREGSYSAPSYLHTVSPPVTIWHPTDLLSIRHAHYRVLLEASIVVVDSTREAYKLFFTIPEAARCLPTAIIVCA